MPYPFLDLYSKIPLLIQAIEIRRQRNKDTIIIIIGEKRSSKSYTAIKLAEWIKRRRGQSFDVNKACFFDPKPFLYWQKDAMDDICILDEFSESCDARSWWDIQNRIYNSIFTTQGYKKCIYLTTFPHLKSLDSRAIRLSHYIIKTMDIGLVKCSRIYPADFTEKIYTNTFEIIKLGLPSKSNIDKYEKMKKEWNEKRHQQHIDYVERLDSMNKKAFNERQYLKAFSMGILNEDSLKERLIKLNYSDNDISMVIETAKAKLTDEKKKEASRREL